MNVSSYLSRASSSERRRASYKELVAEYYDGVTQYYYRGWGECFHFAPFKANESSDEARQAQHAYVVEQADIQPAMKVLDVGCGIGGPARSIATLSKANVTGITISSEQVRLANAITAKKGLSEQCQFVLHDAMKMSFEDESFDVVYMIESACHMPDKAAFYAECARVLKKGGRLAGWDWIATPDGQDAATVAKYNEPICTYFSLPTLSTLNEIEAHLQDSGLTVKKLENMVITKSGPRPWWEQLEKQVGGPLSKVASCFSKTLKMMRESGVLLVTAGKASVFSPLGFFVAQKGT